jgi:hypothetical protein
MNPTKKAKNPLLLTEILGYKIVFIDKTAETLAAREREMAAARQTRDRAIIAKLCRQKRYRDRYQALGLWPLPEAA